MSSFLLDGVFFRPGAELEQGSSNVLLVRASQTVDLMSIGRLLNDAPVGSLDQNLSLCTDLLVKRETHLGFLDVGAFLEHLYAVIQPRAWPAARGCARRRGRRRRG